jgi:hypothetical protein
MFIKKIEAYVSRLTSSDEAGAVLSRMFVAAAPRDRPYFDPVEAREIKELSRIYLTEFRLRREWTRSLGDNGLPLMLSGMTTAEAMLGAAKAAGAYDGIPEIPFSEEDEETVHVYPDGFAAVRLATWEAVGREARRFGASPSIEGVFGKGDLEEGRIGIWLVRGREGETVAAIGFNRIAVCDVVGRNMTAPDIGYVRDYVLPLMDRFGLRPSRPDAIAGMVETADGRLHDLKELPEGSTVDGDLRINNRCPHITSFPANLTVKGKFLVWNNHNITKTPDGLKADVVVFNNCRNLRAVGKGIEAGYAAFTGCSRLATIERGAYFREGLCLPDVPELLRQDFRCDGIVQTGNKEFNGRLLRGLGRVPLPAGFTESIARRKDVPRFSLPGGKRRTSIASYSIAKRERLLAWQAEMDREIEARSGGFCP